MKLDRTEVTRGRASGRGRGLKLLAATATVLLAGGVAAACGGDDDDDDGAAAGGETVEAIATVTPEEANDFGWNQQSSEAAEAVGGERDLTVEVVDGQGYEDINAFLREVAQEDVQFIDAHASGYNTAAPDVAVETEVPFLVWDNPEANDPGLVANAGTSSEQGAYLAGVLAAEATETGTLGIVISADDVNWNRMAGGFVAGARSVDPNVDISFAQIGQAAYADAAGGKRVTETVIADGADVIFGMGDGSTFGMLQAVEAADDVQFIDVIGDKSSTDDQGVLLSSVLWNFETVYDDAIDAIEDGTFGEKSFDLNLGNDGISLLETDLFPDGVQGDLEEIEQQIIDGEVEVPETTKKSQVNDLIQEG